MDVDKPPATPLRPPKPSVIYNDSPENPAEQRSRSGVITHDFNQSQRNEHVNSEETVPADSCNVSKTTTRQFLLDGAAGLNNVSFTDLLALANAAMTTNSSVPLQGKDNAWGSSCSVSNSTIFGNEISYCSAYEIGTKQWTGDDNCIEETQDKLPASSPWHSQPQDLNCAPARMEDTFFSISSTSQFSPATPEKPTKAEKNNVTAQNTWTGESTNKELHSNNAIDNVGLVENNEVQLDKQTLSTSVTPFTENHSPDKGSSDSIIQNQTPQKKPRRRKHRPRIITEAKPRTPKSIPNPDVSKETPRVKRKYVRKKPLDKTPSSLSAEKFKEPIDAKETELANKSCRRALNFDVEEQPQCKNPAAESTLVLESETRAQGVSIEKIQPTLTTLHLGQGIEVVLGTTEIPVAYSLNCSMSDLLKGYISVPKMQVLDKPLLPAERGPWLTDRYAMTGEAINADKDDQMASAERSQAQPHSPKEVSNIPNHSISTSLLEEGKDGASKRKHSEAIEAAETSCTTIDRIHCDTQNADQMMFCFPFPNILKKKRSEKGHSSTASSTSSSIKKIENVVKAFSIESEDKYWTFGPQEEPSEVINAEALQDGMQSLEHLMTSGQMKRVNKKRSRGPTRPRDLASLTRILECNMPFNLSARQEIVACDDDTQVSNSHRPHTCIEDMVTEMGVTLARKKRSTKRSPTTHELQVYQRIASYNQHQLYAKNLGAPPQILWQELPAMDAIIEQLKHLDINKEGTYGARQKQNALVPYGIRNKENNAMVLYRRDGTLVNFEGAFDPIKKRKPRPKVDLDDETNRVWKLLLQDINSEGIDGTEEDKVKWWEEERRVFRGRADSFIARMHLVQGDRRFSQWKGSVVDSVIGVFLTQNVSDHLSSSAFISMAARFPPKSMNNHKACHEEGTSSSIDEPVLCAPGLKQPTKWHEMSNQPICDHNSIMHNENGSSKGKDVPNSSDSFGSSCSFVCLTNEIKDKFGSAETCQDIHYESAVDRIKSDVLDTRTVFEGLDAAAPNDMHSTQNSTVSVYNSMDSPISQHAERKESSESSTEVETVTDGSLNGSTSNVEVSRLLDSKMHSEVYSHQTDVAYNENAKESMQTKTEKDDDHGQNAASPDGPRCSLVTPMSPSACCHLQLSQNSGLLDMECYELFTEETISSEVSKNKDENSTKESPSTSEWLSQPILPKMQTPYMQETRHTSNRDQSCNIQYGDKMNLENHSERPHHAKSFAGSSEEARDINIQCELTVPSISEEMVVVTESSSACEDRRNTQQITAEPEINKHGYLTSEQLKKASASMKAKSRRVGKEINNDFQWESLKIFAEANGKRERTADSMDSVDWDSVRRADVDEVAETIKARGMNNMLAERIKAFLDRLVKEHGSIDLEWLRDIPPDQAKEYLLSVRGLGLKSVECVRLLTLHQLAFPVDTNVGRIAVRLGWVPLQPLPESLQLHLLELYPVLDSIQRYLWPRLCKLDQRELYELHYQMITFGKVFCTKSKPNCNACPMRGECRHFASAFASARLALPGPEENGIVVASESSAESQIPGPVMNPEVLCLSPATEISESKQLVEAAYNRINNQQPIIEEPATPEPDCSQDPEIDMEDVICEDPNEIPTIKLNIEAFTMNLQNYMQQNMELQEGDISKALVALTTHVASIPVPKLKNVSQLRTEHQVYELPDSHPLLEGLEKREPDDPCTYLLAIWTPGETADCIQPPGVMCSSHKYGQMCHESTCFSCNSTREANAQIVRGTLLIPCRTAMRGSFPLNGTYFQVNEVFADHDSSLNPIDVPRSWIWNLPRRTVYFGTSIPTIFKGLTTEGIQHCFWRGYVCVRGFDQKTRAPRPLMARLHFPASKLRGNRQAEKMQRTSE